jgi:hypothetical protein
LKYLKVIVYLGKDYFVKKGLGFPRILKEREKGKKRWSAKREKTHLPLKNLKSCILLSF